MDFRDLDIEPTQLLALVCGVLLGYLCVVLAIDLQLYYAQSRVVTAELYRRLKDAEKGEPVSSPLDRVAETTS